MSYKQAIEDHIRLKRSGKRLIAYYPPCHRCGRETYSMSYISGNKYTCKICKSKMDTIMEQSKGMAKMRRN